MNDAMTTVAMVMAHNKVILWDWNKSIQLSSAECETQCILYPRLVTTGLYKDSTL